MKKRIKCSSINVFLAKITVVMLPTQEVKTI